MKMKQTCSGLCRVAGDQGSNVWKDVSGCDVRKLKKLDHSKEVQTRTNKSLKLA